MTTPLSPGFSAKMFGKKKKFITFNFIFVTKILIK